MASNDFPEPEVTSIETITHRAGYQSLEPVTRPSWWGVDLDPTRRPGVPMEGLRPQPMPNARWPITPMQGESSAPKHNRPNREMPPVFATATPLHGLSGVIRRYAYSYADHYPVHWLLLMAGDRLDSMTYHAKKYGKFAMPALGAFLLLRRALK